MAVASTKSMKKPIVVTSATILAVTVSVAAFYRTSGNADAPDLHHRDGQRVATSWKRSRRPARSSAVTTVQVGSQVSGTIQSLHADFNSRVQKGQVIARLDPSLLQAQVDQAAGDDRPAAGGRRTGARDRSTTREVKLAARAAAVASRADCRGPTSRRPQSTARQAEASLQGGPGAGRRRRAPRSIRTGQPRSHRHHRAGRRHRHLAQRRRRPDGGGQHVGADAVRHRQGPDADAGRGEHRRGGHRPHPRRTGGDVPRGRLSDRDLHGHRLAGAAAAVGRSRTSSAT